MKIALLFTLILSSYTVSRSQSERDAGIDFYRAGNYENAIETLRPLVERSDADYPTALYLGAAYVRTASLDKATELFRNLNRYKAPTVPLRYEKDVKVKKLPKAECNEVKSGSFRSSVAVELKYDGNIGFIFPFESTSEKLYEGALNAAKAIRFKAAVADGKPVTVVRVFEYTCQKL